MDADWQVIADGTFLSALGPVVRRERDGMIEFGLQTDERHQNLSGIVHGGVIMTLMDRAIGTNARAASEWRRMATASMTVNFLRQAKIGSFLHITCRLMKNGRKAAFGEATLRSDDQIVATATGVFMTVDSPGG